MSQAFNFTWNTRRYCSHMFQMLRSLTGNKNHGIWQKRGGKTRRKIQGGNQRSQTHPAPGLSTEGFGAGGGPGRWGAPTGSISTASLEPTPGLPSSSEEFHDNPNPFHHHLIKLRENSLYVKILYMCLCHKYASYQAYCFSLSSEYIWILGNQWIIIMKMMIISKYQKLSQAI